MDQTSIKGVLIEDMNYAKLNAFFEIDSTVSWIKQHGFRRVALQFPDCFLAFSARIASHLQRGCDDHEIKTFILADTTYRSCCVDFVAAEQCSADCIVHYGDSCMSETTNRLPIRFVYGNMPVDWEELKKALKWYKEKFEQKCCLLYDAAYANSLVTFSDNLFDSLSEFIDTKSLFHCKFIKQSGDLEHNEPSTSNTSCLGRQIPQAKDNMTVLFIGEPNGPLLPLFLMTNLNCISAFTFSPTTLRSSFEKTSAIRHLRKRLFLIEKLRDAQTVGIVVNTLDVVGYGEAIKRTRTLCKLAGKKSYTLAVGKVRLFRAELPHTINLPKLSNFANDIEAFIILSCPFGIILDVSDFFRPIVSLFEAEVAMNPNNNWSAGDGWTAEFRNFLHDEIGKEGGAKADVSLITGKIRSMGVEEAVDDGKNSCNVLSTYSAGDYFLGRTWKGLDDSYADESVAVSKGRSGIASQYKSEPPI